MSSSCLTYQYQYPMKNCIMNFVHPWSCIRTNRYAATLVPCERDLSKLSLRKEDIEISEDSMMQQIGGDKQRTMSMKYEENKNPNERYTLYLGCGEVFFSSSEKRN